MLVVWVQLLLALPLVLTLLRCNPSFCS